jgi:hypothetical protein
MTNGHRWGDDRILDYLNEEHEWKYPRNVPYHPRSDKHGGLQCRHFLDDLLHVSDPVREAAAAGEIVYAEDYDVGDSRGLGWNVDLVMGPPEGEAQTQLGDGDGMEEGEPAEIWLAVDAKAVMTEHQKARRNRQRDINSFADIMHTHDEKAITAGIVMVNLADKFDSPTRDADDYTEHSNVNRIVGEIIDLFGSIDRAEGEMSANLDEVACVVVNHTNYVEDAGDSYLVTEPPAPEAGDQTHYRTFVSRIAATFEDRFLDE